MKWYYTDGTKNVGPLSDEAMRQMRTSGILRGDTWVRPADSEAWVAFDKAFQIQPDLPERPVALEQSASSTEPVNPLPGIPVDEVSNITAHQPPEDPNSPDAKRRRKAARKRREMIVSAVVGLALIAAGGGAFFYFSGARFGGRSLAPKQVSLTQADPKLSDLKAKAESGDARAQYEYGMRLVGRSGGDPDESDVNWFRMAADQGFAAAQTILGVCYEEGFGLPKNGAEAVKWYRKAADQGFDEAEVLLGACYEKGLCFPKSDAEAAKWYRKAADQGHAVAQCGLAMCYSEGRGVPKDADEAAKWFRLSAEQGCDTAQFCLAACYQDGIGVPRNDEVAVHWYKKASEQGLALAQYNLAACFATGRGVIKNPAEAAVWAKKAADQGHAKAQLATGINYIDGNGVEKDLVLASMWLALAAASSDGEAATLSKAQLRETSGSMTPAQIAKAQELAGVWTPKAENGNARQNLLNHTALLVPELRSPETNVEQNAAASSETSIEPETAGAAEPLAGPAPAPTPPEPPPSQNSKPPLSPTPPATEPATSPKVTKTAGDDVRKALDGFKTGTLAEAKECVSRLEAVQIEYPNDEEVGRVKEAVTAVFRAESALATATGELPKAKKAADEQLRNAQISQRPSALTGRVDLNAANAYRAKAARIVAEAQGKIDSSRDRLRLTLEEAKNVTGRRRGDRIESVWKEVGRRNKIALDSAANNNSPALPQRPRAPDTHVVKILNATYESGGKNATVSQRVRDFVEVKRQKFSATPKDLGADPNPRQNKSLLIVYTVDGVRHEQRRNENETILINGFYKE